MAEAAAQRAPTGVQPTRQHFLGHQLRVALVAQLAVDVALELLHQLAHRFRPAAPLGVRRLKPDAFGVGLRRVRLVGKAPLDRGGCGHAVYGEKGGARVKLVPCAADQRRGRPEVRQQ